MTYDYLTINFTSVSGFIFLLIFLYANASLEPKIKRIFYQMIFLEFIEMLTYSLELWTTTFDTLSQARLWLSAIGYSVRPIIFCLMMMLAMRNTKNHQFPKIFYLPVIANVIAAFSLWITSLITEVYGLIVSVKSYCVIVNIVLLISFMHFMIKKKKKKIIPYESKGRV